MRLNTGQSIHLSAAFTLRVYFGEILCELSVLGILVKFCENFLPLESATNLQFQ